MCGIAGFVRRERARNVEAELVAQRLTHRGPDDVGFLTWSGQGSPVISRTAPTAPADVVLVHTRLSILDLSGAGWQPMRSHDGTCFLSFNGEIYNYRELRAELVRAGHRFSSDGDTEVLLAAWSEWGDSCLPRLRGMFAFAVLDIRRRVVTLARDAFGIKPLFFAQSSYGIAFASEIPPLLQLTGRPARADAEAVRDYLLLGITDHSSRTCFEGVEAVPPGTVVEVPLGGVAGAPRPWYVPVEDELDVSFDEAARAIRELFVDSIALHLRSDRVVGTALSGGIDSSSVIAAVREVCGKDVEIRAFSYIADDPAVDESRWINIAARNAGAQVHTTMASSMELVQDLDPLIRTQGEPFGSTSIYAQRRVFDLASRTGVTVMLDGQGADELLAGYESLVPARATELLRLGRVADAVRLTSASGRGKARLGTAWHVSRAAAGLLPAGAVRLTRRALGHQVVAPWLNSDWFAAAGVSIDPSNERWRSKSLREALDQALFVTSLPALLRYEDRNSMAFSIESRVPFLDPALVEFVRRLPAHVLLTNDGTTKAVFRQAMRGLVPDEILDRRDKIGFATPERRWLPELRQWVTRTLESDTAQAVRALVPSEVSSEYEAVVSGQHRFDWHLWRCLNLIRWSELFGVEWA